MAAAYDDSALRAELQAALASLDPEVEGLQNMAAILGSSSGKIAVSNELGMRSRRRAFILSLISALDAVSKARAELDADGYPTFTQPQVNDAVLKEMQDAETGLVVAATLFGASASPPRDQATISKLHDDLQSNQAAINAAMHPA